MKNVGLLLVIVLLLCLLGQSFAQLTRKPQIELFGGVAVPLSPDEFKDYYKVGASIHGQYVMFPSPKLGISFGAAYETFTFDGDALLEDIGYADMGVKVTGGADVLELGVGLRPYLTPVEASTQFFIFGMATYNVLTQTAKVSYMGQTEEIDEDDSKFGVAAGAGIEVPATESLNLIIQGLTRFIFTEEETTSFIGITAGVVF